jgi:hypothetical protein
VIEAQRASDSSRSFEVQFADKDDGGGWTPLQSGITIVELLETPKFMLLYSTRKKMFSHTVFLSDDASGPRLKKFGPSYTPNSSATAFKLRDPQTEALLKLRKVLHPEPASSPFMVILPAGCGKTVVMAMAPFM